MSMRPNGMDEQNWKFLCCLMFGLIIFANQQKDNDEPIPPEIANGDLDGDTYFVCWSMIY